MALHSIESIRVHIQNTNKMIKRITGSLIFTGVFIFVVFCTLMLCMYVFGLNNTSIPAVSIEFARKVLMSKDRPSFFEVEEAVAALPNI